LVVEKKRPSPPLLSLSFLEDMGPTPERAARPPATLKDDAATLAHSRRPVARQLDEGTRAQS
jgi:hypothetical protein